jgi:hypothetical protein
LGGITESHILRCQRIQSCFNDWIIGIARLHPTNQDIAINQAKLALSETANLGIDKWDEQVLRRRSRLFP